MSDLNQDLNSLIYNDLFLKKIHGPYYCSYFEGVTIGNNHPRNFLIFGEAHYELDIRTEDNNITDWFKKLYENAPVCTDFFLEYFITYNFKKIGASPLKPLKPQTGGAGEKKKHIDELRNEFDSKYDNSDSDKSKIRLHNVDLRQKYDILYWFDASYYNSKNYDYDEKEIEITFDSNNKYKKNEKTETRNQLKDLFQKFFRYISIDKDNFFDFLSKFLLGELNKDSVIDFYIRNFKNNLNVVIKNVPESAPEPAPEPASDPASATLNEEELLIENQKKEKIKQDKLKNKIKSGYKELLTESASNLDEPKNTNVYGYYHYYLMNKFGIDELNGNVVEGDLKEYFNHYFGEIIDLIKKQLMKCIIDKNLFLKIFKELYKNKYKENIEDFRVLLMDLYTIARMFSNFKLEKHKSKNKIRNCKDEKFKDPINSIFYGGQFHSNIYTEFIKKLLEDKGVRYSRSFILMDENKKGDYENLHLDFSLIESKPEEVDSKFHFYLKDSTRKSKTESNGDYISEKSIGEKKKYKLTSSIGDKADSYIFPFTEDGFYFFASYKIETFIMSTDIDIKIKKERVEKIIDRYGKTDESKKNLQKNLEKKFGKGYEKDNKKVERIECIIDGIRNIYSKVLKSSDYSKLDNKEGTLEFIVDRFIEDMTNINKYYDKYYINNLSIS